MNHEFELRELIRSAKKMRASQIAFFKNKDSHNRYQLLQKSKELEQEFDRKLGEIETNINQTKLEI